MQTPFAPAEQLYQCLSLISWSVHDSAHFVLDHAWCLQSKRSSMALIWKTYIVICISKHEIYTNVYVSHGPEITDVHGWAAPLSYNYGHFLIKFYLEFPHKKNLLEEQIHLYANTFQNFHWSFNICDLIWHVMPVQYLDLYTSQSQRWVSTVHQMESRINDLNDNTRCNCDWQHVQSCMHVRVSYSKLMWFCVNLGNWWLEPFLFCFR